MRSSIGDYEVMETVEGWPAGSAYLCRPPARLKVEGPVVLTELLAGPGEWSVVAENVVRWAATDCEDALLLFEAGPDPAGAGGYLATEPAPGGALSDPAAPADAALRVNAVAAAARAAHAHHQTGLPHGHIRPSAILLTDRGPMLAPPPFNAPTGAVIGGWPKTGPAVRAAMGGTRPSDLAAVDPDMFRGERPSRASDIWSLGATLHMALSDRELYPGIGGDEMVTAVQRVLFTRPEIDPSLPGPLRNLVERCLEPDRAARPESALEVATLLTDVSVEGMRGNLGAGSAGSAGSPGSAGGVGSVGSGGVGDTGEVEE